MDNSVLLIGFSGAAGSGKTTAADMITDIIDKKINCLAEPNKPNLVINVQKFAFGSALKQILIDIFGFTNAQLNTPEGKSEFNKKWGMTNREALQKFGTDAIRQHFHKDAWVFAAECTLNQMITDRSNLSIPLVILCHDVRFVNEADLILDRGGVIVNIERPDVKCLTLEESKHASEAGLPKDCITTTVINDGSLKDFRTKMEALVDLFILSVLMKTSTGEFKVDKCFISNDNGVSRYTAEYITSTCATTGYPCSKFICPLPNVYASVEHYTKEDSDPNNLKFTDNISDINITI